MRITEIAPDATDAASRQLRSDDIWGWWDQLTEAERLAQTGRQLARAVRRAVAQGED